MELFTLVLHVLTFFAFYLSIQVDEQEFDEEDAGEWLQDVAAV